MTPHTLTPDWACQNCGCAIASHGPGGCQFCECPRETFVISDRPSPAERVLASVGRLQELAGGTHFAPVVEELMAAMAADTTVADLRQEIEFLKAETEGARPVWTCERVGGMLVGGGYRYELHAGGRLIQTFFRGDGQVVHFELPTYNFGGKAWHCGVDPTGEPYVREAPEAHDPYAKLMDEVRSEILRQDRKHGPFEGSPLGASRLALACIRDEVDEAEQAWRDERKTNGWPRTGYEVLQVAAVALRALRDAFPTGSEAVAGGSNRVR